MPSLVRRIAVASTLSAMFCAAAIALAADLKITTRNSMAGNSSEGTTYIKGSRQRSETQFGPVHQVTITQCDRRQTIIVSDACHAYMVTPMDPAESGTTTTSAPPPAPSNNGTRQGGTITIDSNSTNTGETQQMFGYTARHIKTSMSMTSSPDACNPNNMRMESDGWYADFSAAGMTCSASPRPGNMGRVRPDCQDRMRFTGNGMRSHGYPMKLTTTITDSQGRTFTTTQETLELSRATLDPALFDVPAGYQRVDSYQGLMCQAAMTGGGGRGARSGGGNYGNAHDNDADGEGQGSRSAQDDEMQRHRRGGRGPLCVAPVMNKAATSIDNEAWLNTLVDELQRVRVESVKLESTNQFDLRAEAVQKGCHVVLYTDVMDLRAPAPGRRLGRAAGGNVAANYQSTVHLELEPTDAFVPWLDSTANGTGNNSDRAGEGALRSEAQQVAVELSKPH